MDRARQLAILGMVVSGCLAALKITAGWFGRSAAVSADGFESASDVFTSGLVLVGLTIAARPADENHPYGHGRIEILTGFLLGIILFGAGSAIAWHGLTGAADKGVPPASWVVWAMLISIAAKSWLVTLKFRYGRKIGSSSLLADAANDGVDMLSGLVALAGVATALINPERFLRADHYGAFVVGRHRGRDRNSRDVSVSYAADGYDAGRKHDDPDTRGRAECEGRGRSREMLRSKDWLAVPRRPPSRSGSRNDGSSLP